MGPIPGGLSQAYIAGSCRITNSRLERGETNMGNLYGKRIHQTLRIQMDKETWKQKKLGRISALCGTKT